MDYRKRVRKIQSMLAQLGLDLVVLPPGPSMLYVTGFTADVYERVMLCLVPKYDDPIMLVPKLEEERASYGCWCETVSYGDDEEPWAKLRSLFKSPPGLKRIGVDGAIRYLEVEHLKKVFPKASFQDVSDAMLELRSIKEEQEVEAIMRAGREVKRLLDKAKELIKPGAREDEISFEVEKEATMMGFRSYCLLQSGPNSAIPHHYRSNRRVEDGDVIVVDIVLSYKNYHADVTRPFFVKRVDDEAKRVFEIVNEAQEAAIHATRPLVEACSLDGEARHVIGKAGYGRNFVHRTGHGIGLAVHERPYIAPNDKSLIKPGMVFTVEPGIYIKGKFGIRIEDDVLVTGKGCEVLTERPSGIEDLITG